MEITCRVYRPRRARDTPLFRLVEQHLEEFLRVYQERFAKAHGPLPGLQGFDGQERWMKACVAPQRTKRGNETDR